MSVGLTFEQLLHLGVRLFRVAQELDAEPAEFLFLKKKILADTGVEPLHRVHCQVESGSLSIIRALQRLIGALECPVGVLLDRRDGGETDQSDGHGRCDGRGDCPVVLHPAPGPSRPWFGPGRHRLVGEPAIDVVSQGARTES